MSEFMLRVYNQGRQIVEQHINSDDQEVHEHWEDGVLIIEVDAPGAAEAREGTVEPQDRNDEIEMAAQQRRAAIAAAEGGGKSKKVTEAPAIPAFASAERLPDEADRRFDGSKGPYIDNRPAVEKTLADEHKAHEAEVAKTQPKATAKK